MATLYTHQDSNVRKTWLLMAIFFVVVIGIGWVFAQAYGNPAILYVAVIFSLFMNFFSYWNSDKIALVISGAKEVSHDNARELYHIVENLCITAGVPAPKIYLINDPAPNAFATGRNAEHAVIAVTSGLLERLDKTELEGVIAHELSHIGNKDILLSTVVVVLVGFISLISDWFLRSLWHGRSRDNDSKGNGIMMIIGIVFAILAPIATTLIQLAISRKREFLADASGALLTRYPEGLASALEKISQYTQPMASANGATAHMYISNPFGAKKMMSLFATHPPVEERIKALRGMSV